MDFLAKCVQNFSDLFSKQENAQISRKQAYLSIINKILVWDNQTLSYTVLVCLNVLLWIIIKLELRLFGLVFLAIFLLYACDDHIKQIGGQQNPPEQLQHVLNIFTYLKNLRIKNPEYFCGIVSALFVCLLLLNGKVSGPTLAYASIDCLFIIAPIVSRLPPEYLAMIQQTFNNFSSNEGVIAENELIPLLIVGENGRDPDLDSLLADKTADSVPNSFLSGLSPMPSYLDAEGSLDGLEEEDLELPQRSVQSNFAGDYSSDSDSEHKGITFESSHFNGDGSSSDDEIKDLNFSENAQTESRLQNLTAGILSNLAAVGGNFVSNVLRTGTLKPNESDSDFEIINSEDAEDAS